MKQEAMNVLLTRRSVRQYQARQVSEQELDQVLQAGLYAPTGKNVQGVELVAVQEKKLRDRLAALNKSFWDKDMDPYYGAPTIILVLADTVRYTWVEDGSCALCNMLNAAMHWGWAPAGSTASGRCSTRKRGRRTSGSGAFPRVCGVWAALPWATLRARNSGPCPGRTAG